MRSRAVRSAAGHDSAGVAPLLTDLPGTSQWFDRALAADTTAAKTGLPGVASDVLTAHGAVTEEAERAMAEGARTRFSADRAGAVSGIAGPSGAVAGKPIGTVWFALAQKLADRLECQGHLIQFDGDRDAVRRQSVEYALNLLRALPPPVD